MLNLRQKGMHFFGSKAKMIGGYKTQFTLKPVSDLSRCPNFDKYCLLNNLYRTVLDSFYKYIQNYRKA